MGYLAGIIDGEGCIGAYLSQNSVNLSVKVGQKGTRPTIIDWLCTKFPEGVRQTIEKSDGYTWDSWEVAGNKALRLLNTIEAHVLLKRDQVVLAKAILALSPGRGRHISELDAIRRALFVQKMSECNQR